MSAIREFLDLYGTQKGPSPRKSDSVLKEDKKDVQERRTNLAEESPHKAAHDSTRSESFSSEYRTPNDVR